MYLLLRLLKTHYAHADGQKGVSQEWIWVLIWNFQRKHNEEDQLTKRKYIQVTANTNSTVTLLSLLLLLLL